MGSGYCTDPNTKKWLSENKDNCFGYPNFVRFCWSTIKDIVKVNRFKFKFTEEIKIEE